MSRAHRRDLQAFTGRLPRELLPAWRKTLLRLAGL
jgi:hypothetical protein